MRMNIPLIMHVSWHSHVFLAICSVMVSHWGPEHAWLSMGHVLDVHTIIAEFN